MGNTSSGSGRRCVAFKKVKTDNGVARRCARFSDSDESETDGQSHFRGFSSASAALNSSYKGMDLLVGAGAGLVGTLGVKWAANKFLAGKLPAVVMSYFPVFGAAAVAAALYFGEKKSARGAAHAIGALTAGLSVSGWAMLQQQFPSLASVVAFQYDGYGRPYGNYGILQNDYAPAMGRGYQGLLVDDTSSRNLSDLANLSMSDSDGDDASALLGMGG